MIYNLLWYFYLYAFLGWCAEVAFAAFNRGAFVNRGFLNGPFCPIYGVGIVLAVYALLPLSDSLPVLYIGSVVVISLVELVTGFLMQKLFHQRWWNYSHMKFNLGGYICLQASLGWGVAYMLIVRFVHPLVVRFVAWIPHTAGLVLLGLISILFAADVAATVRTVLKLNHQLEEVDLLAARIRESADLLAAGIAGGSFGIAGKTVDRLETLAERQETRWQQRIDKIEQWAEAREERREGRMAGLAELAEQLDIPTDWHEDWTEEQHERREEIDEQLEQLRNVIRSKNFGLKRLFSAFPNLQSNDYEEALKLLQKGLSKPQDGTVDSEQ